VMDELDMDGGGDLELTELTAKLDEYRRQRRSFAANVLGGVLEHTQRTKTSVTRGKIVILPRFVALSFSLTLKASLLQSLRAWTPTAPEIWTSRSSRTLWRRWGRSSPSCRWTR